MENTQISGMEVGKIAVYWINHGYYSDQTFDTIGQNVKQRETIRKFLETEAVRWREKV
jgi:hypothetical protein